MSGEQPPRVKRPKLQTDQSGSSYIKVKKSFTTSSVYRNGALKCKTEGSHPTEYSCTEWPQVGQSLSRDVLNICVLAAEFTWTVKIETDLLLQQVRNKACGRPVPVYQVEI